MISNTESLRNQVFSLTMQARLVNFREVWLPSEYSLFSLSLLLDFIKKNPLKDDNFDTHIIFIVSIRLRARTLLILLMGLVLAPLR